MSQPASASFPWSQVPEPAAGRKEYGQVSWPGLPGETRPVIALRGSVPGPAVLIMAGFQHASYPALHGLLRLTGSLDPARVRGALLALPDASLADWDWLKGAMFSPATALIEIGGAAPNRQSASYVTRYLSGAAEADRQAGLMAAGFSMEYQLSRQLSPSLRNPGNQMASNGRPAIEVTLPGDPGNRDRAIRQVVDGLTNVLRAIGMLDGPPSEVEPGLPVIPSGLIVSPVAGLWNPAVHAGKQVRASDEIGWLDDDYGVERARLTANRAGNVLWYSTVLSVQAREPLILLVNTEY